jgi:hypothetical protein
MHPRGFQDHQRSSGALEDREIGRPARDFYTSGDEPASSKRQIHLSSKIRWRLDAASL